MSEIWKQIDGFEGYYSVSNLGRIRSEDRISASGRKLKGKILRQDRSKVFVWGEDGNKQYLHVSRLVIDAFIGWPDNDDYCVRYIDGNFENNSVKNIEFFYPHEEKTSHLYSRMIGKLRKDHPEIYNKIKENVSTSKNGYFGIGNNLKKKNK